MTTSPRIPVLHAGDRLTRTEFERRYLAMSGLKKAELLEGVVYMPSPVRLTFHAEPHGLLCGWLAVYAAGTPGVAHAIDATLRVDEDNEVQPDLMLRILGATGRSRVDADHYVVGAPELLVEVAASSVSYDLHQKLHVYRRAGVREYLVLRAEDAAVDWFELRDGRYEPIAADRPGVLASRAFPGLRLDVPALLAGDDAALHAAVRAGLATDQHAAFAASLRR
jgi:Uma2 family endonuclease